MFVPAPEYVVFIAAVVFMTRVAAVERRSALAWGVLTFLLCLAALAYVPFPLRAFAIGGVVAAELVVLTVWNVLRKRPSNV